MAAGRDDHETPPLYDIAGGMLVGMPVGDKSPAPLLLGEVINRGRLDQGVGQYPLKRLARDVLPRRTRHRSTPCRPLLHRVPHDRARPQGARLLVARADPLLAESLLAAGEELQIVTHTIPMIMGDKAGQPAVIVAVSVAQNE